MFVLIAKRSEWISWGGLYFKTGDDEDKVDFFVPFRPAESLVVNLIFVLAETAFCVGV